MTTRLASLEAALEQIALEIADKLLATAVSAPISELTLLLRDDSELASILAAALTRVTTERASGHASGLRRRESPRGTRARPERAEPRAALRATPARERLDEIDDGDALANAITDPSLLLEVIGARRPSSRPAELTSELLSPAALSSERRGGEQGGGEPGGGEQGPSLRPGESLQRTAGGGVVLRRGAK